MMLLKFKILIWHLANKLLGGKLDRLYGKNKWRAATDLYGKKTWRVNGDIGGNKILYDPTSVIGGLLFHSGQFEKNEMETCRKYILKNSTILDIGANIGLHSIYFSEIAREGSVLSFEPSLSTFDLLIRNVSDKPNITPINLAISDSGGLLDFFQASDDAYSSLMDTKRKSIVKVSKVPSMKIDDVVDALQLRSVDFVKIDVEGFEYNVLKGMGKVIAKHRPVIFCEIYQGTASNPAPDATVKYLLDRHYSAYVMHDGELVEYVKHEDRFFNYLFLPAGGIQL